MVMQNTNLLQLQGNQTEALLLETLDDLTDLALKICKQSKYQATLDAIGLHHNVGLFACHLEYWKVAHVGDNQF
jgi:hypothetical protein